MKPHMTNRGLQGGAFRKDTTPERRRRPIRGSEFPRSRATDNESRDDAFKNGASFAVAGPSEDRTGFHPGQNSSPPNATPRRPYRPHGHGHQAAPSHGLRPRVPRNHHQGHRPDIQDLDTTSPETCRYPNQRGERKGPTFRTPGRPQCRDPIGRSPGLHRPVLHHRA